MEPSYGLRAPGEAEKHIIAEDLGNHRALAMCGATLTVWPLADGQTPRIHERCAAYFWAATAVKPKEGNGANEVHRGERERAIGR